MQKYNYDVAILTAVVIETESVRRLYRDWKRVELSHDEQEYFEASFEKDGVRFAFAKSAKGLFVDARKPPVGRTVSFGGVTTDGSFRFANWTIVPLPSSGTFSVEIDLAAFSAAGRAVAGVDTVDPQDGAKSPAWSQDGNVLKVECDAKSFAYRIRFGE